MNQNQQVETTFTGLSQGQIQPSNDDCDIKDTNGSLEVRELNNISQLIFQEPKSVASLSLIGLGSPSVVIQFRRSPVEVPWFEKKVVDGYQVSPRVISDADRREAEAAWRHASRLGTPLNMHVAVKPPTDHLSPSERICLWTWHRQKLRTFCQTKKFGFVCITTRESDPDTNREEHLHCLIHIPHEYQADFVRICTGWCENTHVERADAVERLMPDGKIKSVLGYVLKAASPQSVHRDHRIMHRRSGAILGDRIFISRNLGSKVRAAFEIGRRAKLRIVKERAEIELNPKPASTASMAA